MSIVRRRKFSTMNEENEGKFSTMNEGKSFNLSTIIIELKIARASHFSFHFRRFAWFKGAMASNSANMVMK